MSTEGNNNSDYKYVDNSKYTPIIEKFILRHILKIIPKKTTPNHITLLSHLSCWLYLSSMILAALVGQDFILKALFFLLGAFFVFSYTCLDALDGIYARKTGQTSKLGEILDHFLDSIHVPLMGLGFYIGLYHESRYYWWGFAAVAIVNVLIYYGQLVKYYKDKIFIHPESGGMEGALTLCLGLVCFIPFFLILPDEWLIGNPFTIPIINLHFTSFMDFATYGFYFIVALGHIPPFLFYFTKNGKNNFYLLGPGLIMCAFGLFLAMDLINIWLFTFIMITISLRFTGGLVIAAALEQKNFPVIDIALIVSIVAIAVLGIAENFILIPEYSITIITMLTIVYLVLRSLLELHKAYKIVVVKDRMVQKILY